MLQRNLRLRLKSSYKTVFAKGKSFPGKYVVIYIYLHNDDNIRKFGFIASKKVGNSVQRNRARRLMREVVRINLPAITEGVEIICIARPGIKGVSYFEVEKTMIQIFKRAKVIKP